MKKIYLHIGLHKTGSSSIQNAIDGYNDGTTAVASFAEVNHSIPLYTIFSEQRYNYHIWRREGYTRDQIDTLVDRYFKILESDLLRQDIKNLLISGEDVSVLNAIEKKKLIDYLLSFASEIEIIAYVRHPIDFVASSSQELIKNGILPPQHGPDYEAKLKPFVELLPERNIMVRDFNDLVEQGHNVVEDFQEVLKLKKLNHIRDNISLNPFQLAIVYQIIALGIDILSERDRVLVFEKILGAVKKYDCEPFNKDKLNNEYFLCFANKNISSDCAWLNETFDINYDPLLTADSRVTVRDLSNYFADILDKYKPNLIAMFEGFDVQFNSAKDYRSNFLELFLSSFGAVKKKQLPFI